MLLSEFRALLETCMLETIYPSNFSMEKFKKFKTFGEREWYAGEKLKSIGRGSSREVYLINPTTVLKVAINKKGLAQNLSELTNSKVSNSLPIARVFDSGDKGAWIEMELATKALEDDFVRIKGIPFSEYLEGDEVQEVLTKLNLVLADVEKLDSWGVVTRDGKDTLVLVDFGMTDSVYSKHYDKNY